MNPPDFSVVVPVYNGALTLEDLYNRTSAVMAGLNKSFEMILVDDASHDGSWDTINHLKAKFPDTVTGIRLLKNTGQHNATLCGIHHSKGNLVITIDEDLQHPPEDIVKLYECHLKNDADLVYGVPVKRQHSFIRNLGSKFVNKFFNVFAHTSGDGSSFRLITRDVAKNMKNLQQKYLLLDEVLSWYTNNIWTVEVGHNKREKGESGYSTLRLVFLTINYIINYTAIPLRLMTYMGIAGSIVTFLISVYYIYDKIFNAVELGFTSLIVAIFFSTSLILFSLGIIGEYISRLYVRDGSPHYIVKEIK